MAIFHFASCNNLPEDTSDIKCSLYINIIYINIIASYFVSDIIFIYVYIYILYIHIHSIYIYTYIYIHIHIHIHTISSHHIRRSIFADVMATCGANGTCYVKNDGAVPFEGHCNVSTLCHGGVTRSTIHLNLYGHGKSPFLMGKSTINGHFQ